MGQRHRANKQVDSGDNTTVYLIVGCVLFFVLSVILHKYTDVFYRGWKIVFLPLAKVIDVIANSFIGDLVNPLVGATKIQAHALTQFISNTPVEHWSAQGFIAMNHFMGQYLLLVFFPIGVYGAVFMFKKTQRIGNAFQHFKNSRLLSVYMISPELKRASEMSFKDHGCKKEGASALSCAQFCEQHGLISIDEEESATDMDVEAAFHVFLKQLGPQFTSKTDIFDAEYGWAAHRIIQHIPLAHRSEAIDYALKGHLYISTALLSLLRTARRFGVVPVQPFLRMKRQQRALWYALASLGRQVAFVEGAGIVAQFNDEHRFKRGAKDQPPPTLMPEQVESAVTGLMQALTEESTERFSHHDSSLWDQLDTGAME